MIELVLFLLLALFRENSTLVAYDGTINELISTAMCEARRTIFDLKDRSENLTNWNDCINPSMEEDYLLRKGEIFLSKPTLYCRGEMTLTVKWSPIELFNNTEQLFFYYIYEIRSSIFDWKPINKTKDNIVTIKELNPGREYAIRLRAIGSKGQLGDPVVTFNITTLSGGKMLSAVQDVSITKILYKEKSLEKTISWIPSEDLVCYYDVLEYDQLNENYNIYEIKNNVNPFSVNLPDLKFGTKYCIAIQAKNEDWTKESIKVWKNFTTLSCLEVHKNNLELCAPLKPKNLTCEVKKSIFKGKCDIILSWAKPNAVPDYYNVTILSNVKNTRETFSIIGSFTNKIFNDLPSRTYYYIKIEAISKGGTSEPYLLQTYCYIDYFYLNLIGSIILASILGLAFTLFYLLINKNQIEKPKNLKSDEFFETLDKTSLSSKDFIDDKILPHEPFDEEFEITRDQIVLCHLLGSGAFGVVHKGILADDIGPPKEIAVKTLRENPSGEDKLLFSKEIEIMKGVGSHKNIVSLIGCCTKSTRPFLIIEYCELGDLQNFLREAWKSMIQMEEMKSISIPRMEINYANIVQSKDGKINYFENIKDSKLMAVNKTYGFAENDVNNIAYNLTSEELLSFARQIAIGMEFLSTNKVVHRDLAARNVLVCSDLTVKISDFGLSKDVYERNFYFKKDSERLPLKWMALESFLHQIYTTQTDVWSFGILLWEIITLGGNPYPSIPMSQIFCLLKQGYRMERPTTCSEPLYKIMLSCWAAKPKDRPSFTQLVKALDNLLEEITDQDYLKLDTDLLAPDHVETE